MFGVHRIDVPNLYKLSARIRFRQTQNREFVCVGGGARVWVRACVYSVGMLCACVCVSARARTWIRTRPLMCVCARMWCVYVLVRSCNTHTRVRKIYIVCYRCMYAQEKEKYLFQFTCTPTQKQPHGRTRNRNKHA